ncbi:STAS domain-containing protein [Amantichitinum ursilacus]|nr:STAS domain-containing protein [Amantichitinum ursilacus]
MSNATMTPQGGITMENAGGQLHAIQWPASGDVVIDLAQVGAVDSAAVSVLLHWQREARRRQLRLQLAHVPLALQELIRLYGVQTLLPASA